MKMSESTHIRIPTELHETIKLLAESEGLSIVDLIRKMTLTEIVFANTDKQLFDKLPSETRLALTVKFAELQAWIEKQKVTKK